MNQYQIENYAGITPEIGNYMMKSGTKQAKNAMSLLSMAVRLPESCSLTLLKEAVEDCKKDMGNSNPKDEESFK